MREPWISLNSGMGRRLLLAFGTALAVVLVAAVGLNALDSVSRQEQIRRQGLEQAGQTKTEQQRRQQQRQTGRLGTTGQLGQRVGLIQSGPQTGQSPGHGQSHRSCRSLGRATQARAVGADTGEDRTGQDRTGTGQRQR